MFSQQYDTIQAPVLYGLGTVGTRNGSEFFARPTLPNAVWPEDNSYICSFDSYQSVFPRANSLMYRESNNTLWEARYSFWTDTWQWKSRHEILPTAVETFFNLLSWNTVIHTRETRFSLFGRLMDGLFGEKINQFYINNWNSSTLLEKREIGRVKLGPQSLQSLYYQDAMVFGITTPQTVPYQPPTSTVTPQPVTIGQGRPSPRFVRFVQPYDVPRPSVSSVSDYALVYDIKVPTQIPIDFNKPLPAQDQGKPAAVLPIIVPNLEVSLANPRIIRRELIRG